jgi:hypothetical protein
MPCDILFLNRDGTRVKTSSWSGTEYKKSTCLSYVGNSYVYIPLPFDIFNRYTDHCSNMPHLTANLLPENIPNVIQEFGQGLGISTQPSKLSRLFSPM